MTSFGKPQSCRRPFFKLGVLLLLCLCKSGMVTSITEKPIRNAEVKIDAVPGKISLSPVNRVEVSRTESTSLTPEIRPYKLGNVNQTYDWSLRKTNSRTTSKSRVKDTLKSHDSDPKIISSSRVSDMSNQNSHPEILSGSRASNILSHQNSHPEVFSSSRTSEMSSDQNSHPEVFSSSRTSEISSDQNSHPEVFNSSRTSDISSHQNSNPEVFSSSRTSEISSDQNSHPEVFTSSRTSDISSHQNSNPEVFSSSRTSEISSDQNSHPEVFTSSRTSDISSHQNSNPEIFTSSRTSDISSDHNSYPEVFSSSTTSAASSDQNSHLEIFSSSKIGDSSSNQDSNPGISSSFQTSNISSHRNYHPKIFSKSRIRNTSRNKNAHHKVLSNSRIRDNVGGQNFHANPIGSSKMTDSSSNQDSPSKITGGSTSSDASAIYNSNPHIASNPVISDTLSIYNSQTTSSSGINDSSNTYNSNPQIGSSSGAGNDILSVHNYNPQKLNNFRESNDLSNHNLNPQLSSPRVDDGKTVMIGAENNTFFVVRVQGPDNNNVAGDSQFAANEGSNYIHSPEFKNQFLHKNGELPYPTASDEPEPSKTPEDFGFKTDSGNEVLPFYPILPDHHHNLLQPSFDKNLYPGNLTFNAYMYPPQFHKLAGSFPTSFGHSDCRNGVRRRPFKRTTGYNPGEVSARAYLKKTSPVTPNMVRHTIKVYEREVDDDDDFFSSGNSDNAPSGSGGFFGVDFSDLAARTKRAPIISQIMDSIMGMVDLTASEDHLPPRVISSLTGLPSSDKFLYLPIKEEEAPDYIPVMENIVVKHGTVIKKNPFPSQPLVKPMRRPKVRATPDFSKEPPWSLTALPPPLPTVNPTARTAKNHLPWALQPLPPPLPTIHPSSSMNYQLWLVQPATYPSEPGVDATTTNNAGSYSVGNGSKPETLYNIPSTNAVTIKLNPKRSKDIQMVKSIDLTKYADNPIRNNINYYNKISNGSKGPSDSLPAYTDNYRQQRPGQGHRQTQPIFNRPDQAPQVSFGGGESFHGQSGNPFDNQPEQPRDGGFPGSHHNHPGQFRPPTTNYRRPIVKKPPALLLKIVPHEQSMIIESPIKFNLELRETSDRPTSCVNCGRSHYGRSLTPKRFKSPPIPGVGNYKEGKTNIEFFKPVVIDIDGDGSQRLMTEEELVKEDSRHFSTRQRKSKSKPRAEKVADSVRLPLNLHETYESKVPSKLPAPFDLEYDQTVVNKIANGSAPIRLRITEKEFS